MRSGAPQEGSESRRVILNIRTKIVSTANEIDPELSALVQKWAEQREKRWRAGWVHSMCLKCFRKRWPHGRYSSWQASSVLRRWEICCFCLQKHKDGIHKDRDPRRHELRCAGIHQTYV